MKEIKNFGVYICYRFNKNEYLKNYEEINKLMYRVLASREKIGDYYNLEDAYDQISELNVEFFTKEFLDAKVYVLFNKIDNTPVCFAIYSHDEERDDWHLEYICTHNEFKNQGCGLSLMKLSINDLKDSPFKTITSVVNEKNLASLYMHQRFAETKGVKIAVDMIDNDRMCFEFDAKNMDLEYDEDMENAMF